MRKKILFLNISLLLVVIVCLLSFLSKFGLQNQRQEINCREESKDTIPIYPQSTLISEDIGINLPTVGQIGRKYSVLDNSEGVLKFYESQGATCHKGIDGKFSCSESPNSDYYYYLTIYNNRNITYYEIHFQWQCSDGL